MTCDDILLQRLHLNIANAPYTNDPEGHAPSTMPHMVQARVLEITTTQGMTTKVLELIMK